MKKIVLAYLFLFALTGLSFGQQLPQYSQYLFNDYVINPAVGGSRPYFEGKSNHRYQWEGITDAPRTYILSVNGPLKKTNVGLGGYLFTDIVGPTRRTGFYLSYAYHIKMTKDIKLSLAVNGGILQFMVDGSKINLRDEGDAILTDGVQSVTLPDAGFGFYMYSDKFFFGGSAPQILKSKIRFFKEGKNPTATLADHYFLAGGYKFDVSDDFALEPSALLKYVEPAPMQPEANLRVIYRDKVWIGGTYRWYDAISAMIGYTYKESISFGYSYDYATTNIRNYSSGTHEVMIGIRFLKSDKEKDASASFE